MPKNWCFWTVVLEKTLESPLDCKEIQPVNPKWNQSWVFIRRTDAEAETPILWPPDANRWLIGKDPDTGKDWRQEEKGTTENEMAGCHHWLNGHEFEQAPGAANGQGSLACCSPWGCKESDVIEQLNWTEAPYICVPSSCKLSKMQMWDFLVAQWIRICLPMQGTQFQSLVWEDFTFHESAEPMHCNYWAQALEPRSHNYWACMLQILKLECPRVAHHNY